MRRRWSPYTDEAALVAVPDEAALVAVPDEAVLVPRLMRRLPKWW
ncbi:hypothetical protein [Kribbella hippodromi]